MARRHFLTILLLAFSPALALGSPAPASVERSPSQPGAIAEKCIVAQSWLDTNRGTFPSDYEGILQYPADLRMAIVATLGADEQSHIWRQQFQRYLDDEPGLTRQQRAVLRDAIALAGPELFARGGDRALRARLLGIELPHLWDRATQLFGRDKAREIFAQLGPADLFAKAIACAAKCSCATPPGDTCGSGKYCDDTSSCGVTRLGCGPGGVYACNGDCASN